MPPTRMKGNKKGESKRRRKTKQEDVPTFVYTREKILQLEKSVVETYGRVYDLRVRTLRLREQTGAVDQEIETLRQDHAEYQETMKVRTEARGALVTEARKRLSAEVAKSEQQRQEQVAIIEGKTKLVEIERVENEAKLGRLKIVLIDMAPFGEQKQQQKELIKTLEEDLKTLKMEQEEELNIDKSEFVRVRNELENKYNSDIATVKKAAKKMIGPCLELQLNEISRSNARLHHRLYRATSSQKELTETKEKSVSRRDAVVGQYRLWERSDRPAKKPVHVRYAASSLPPLELKYTFSADSEQ